MKYVIDAHGKKLGRAASEAAALLRGKGSSDFSRNELPDCAVEIMNASALSLSDKKRNETRYSRYSGYPGGRRETSMKEFIAKKGSGELLRKVILGMLPRNLLRAKLIKRLTVKG